MTAKSIPLREWQAPQEDVVMHFSESTCQIFFSVWDDQRELKENLIGQLTFDRVWSTRSVRSECCPYLTSFEGRSSILEVKESNWHSDVAEYYYSDFSKSNLRNNSHHYIVKGHDIFFEILAESYTEKYINDQNENFISIRREL